MPIQQFIQIQDNPGTAIAAGLSRGTENYMKALMFRADQEEA